MYRPFCARYLLFEIMLMLGLSESVGTSSTLLRGFGSCVHSWNSILLLKPPVFRQYGDNKRHIHVSGLDILQVSIVNLTDTWFNASGNDCSLHNRSRVLHHHYELDHISVLPFFHWTQRPWNSHAQESIHASNLFTGVGRLSIGPWLPSWSHVAWQKADCCTQC